MDGLDEGVGDISSECEQGTNDLLVDPNDNNNNKSVKYDGHMDKCNRSNSPEKERIASIF